MAITPRSQADYPEGLEPLDDSAWVRSVVSAALVEASIPPEQADRVLSAATSSPIDPKVTSAIFSAPQVPKAPLSEDWPELQAESKVEENKERLAEARTAMPIPVKPVAAGSAVAASEPVAASSAVTQRSTNVPAAAGVPSPRGSGGLPVISSGEAAGSLQDDVLVESDASVEGYRTSGLRAIVEWLLVIFLALVVAVLAKEFIVQAFWIPSESMETTVNVGDRVLVNKLSYDFNDVRRGDLVVFSKVEGTPSDTEDLIKRAVALPGETIEVRSDGRLWIWGAGETPDDALLLEEPYLDVNNRLLNAPSTTDAPSSTIWHTSCVNDRLDGSRCTLDDSSYFMLGDNRSRSFDSRGFGPVPEENLIGRAFFRIWPLSAISTL